MSASKRASHIEPPPRVPAGSALEVSIKIEPLLAIIRRHVRHLSPAAARAIEREFAMAFDSTRSARDAQPPRMPRGAASPDIDLVLTSQQAADLAGVSRPFMVARIDAGDVALHQRVGNQRRVLRSSVLAWLKKSKARQRKALARLGEALDDEIFST